jgi:hypothetical protein
MAAAIPWVLKGVGTAFSAKTASKALKSDRSAPAIEKPAEPNIDEAAKNRGEVDRIRRRRGVLSNIFGGATSTGSPGVATKTLLGQ